MMPLLRSIPSYNPHLSFNPPFPLSMTSFLPVLYVSACLGASVFIFLSFLFFLTPPSLSLSLFLSLCHSLSLLHHPILLYYLPLKISMSLPPLHSVIAAFRVLISVSSSSFLSINAVVFFPCPHIINILSCPSMRTLSRYLYQCLFACLSRCPSPQSLFCLFHSIPPLSLIFCFLSFFLFFFYPIYINVPTHESPG